MPSDLIFFKLLTLCFLQTPLLSNITCTAQMWPDTDHVALSSVCACVSLYVGDTNVPAKWLNWPIWYFGCGLMYTRNHIWYEVYISATWQIWWINLCSSGHVAQCQITLTTCLIYPASSSHTTCPNYLHLPFLITKNQQTPIPTVLCTPHFCSICSQKNPHIYTWLYLPQCFDTVGLAAGRASGPTSNFQWMVQNCVVGDFIIAIVAWLPVHLRSCGLTSNGHIHQWLWTVYNVNVNN